jgi:serine/threonine protein kinase
LDDLEKTIERIRADHQDISLEVTNSPRSTVEPTLMSPLTSSLNLLRAIGTAASAEKGYGARLKLGEVLGEGGMGIVRAATQLGLGRTVAVKSLRPELRNNERVVLKLMQEAWVTGRLEHPNVMPIYEVEADENGSPMIVLRRIEGVQWREIMHDPGQVRERFGDQDALEWNLGILMQVCNVVHFAHSRGIIHRDLKPENVMIGKFGEVYLLDWGIAVSNNQEDRGILPLASQAVEMAGTPAYMAPEMMGQQGVRVSERTDIYLLGSMLYEVLAGRPPHEAGSFVQIVRSILLSDPVFPAGVPQELAAICRRAMHPDPDQRYASAEQMRLALQGFVRNIGSLRLAERACRRVDQLMQEIKSPGADPVEHRRHVYLLFGECQFGLKQALDIWPDNDMAHRALVQSTEAMVEYELDRDSPAAAATLLSGFEGALPHLREEIAGATAAKERERKEMESLAHTARTLDPRVGGGMRALFGGMLGLIWTGSPLIGALAPREEIGHLELSLATLILAVLIGASGIAVNRLIGLFRNVITRRFWGAALVAMAGQLVLQLIGMMAGLDPFRVLTLWPLVWFCVSSMIVITLDRRLIPMTLGFLALLFFGLRWPDLIFYAMTASNLLMTLNLVFVWFPLKEWASGKPIVGG